VQPFNVIGETILGDFDQKPFGQRSHVTAIIEEEVDLRIIATDPMAKIAHAKVQVVGEYLALRLPPQSSPTLWVVKSRAITTIPLDSITIYTEEALALSALLTWTL